ncbi:MAG: TolC family protein [Candidatus Gastranaerophilales bacterium]|nr:TolC family protein [Candidatus Gastranaerophilales bacterium]
MRLVCLILTLLFLNIPFAFAKDILFDSPIDLIYKKDCSLDEFCKEFVDDLDIEKFIKEHIESDYVVVSLDECLNVAFKNNFNIRIKDKEYFSEKYLYQNSLSKFLPILSTTSYIADYSGQILVGGVLRDNFHETAISVNMTAQHDLTQGGRLIFEAKASKYFAKSKKHNLNFTRSEVVFYTTKYYYEMLLAKIYIEIYLRNLIERNAQLALAKNLLKSGFGTNFDVIRSQNFSLQARAKLIDALNNFRLSQSRLANLMGIDVNTSLMPFEDEIRPLNLVDENLETESFFKLALDKREDLKAYRNLINYEKQLKNVLITDFIPKPLVNFQQQFQGTADYGVNPNYILTGLINWQPGENTIFGTITKINAQKEKIKQRMLEFENKYRNIKQAIIDARSTSIFNEKQTKINKERMEYSLHSIKLAMLRFNYGKGILLDVIQAQSEATTARVEYVASIIRYNISQAELLFNCGTISIDEIIANYKP